MIYLFGDNELDTQRYELRRTGKRIPLEPRVFQVLAYLIQHRDRMVSKREFFEHLWPHQFVSDWALTRCIKEIRSAIGCSGRRPQFIETLYGHGYRFIAAVTECPQASPVSTTPQDAEHLHDDARDGTAQADTTLSLVSLRDQDDLQVDEESKQVTALGGHLVNASVLVTTLGPQVMHTLQQRFFALALRQVQRYGGTIQHLTDADFVALFGLSLTREDHTLRALLAATALHRDLREPGAGHGRDGEPRREHPGQLQVGLGVHTGPVWVWRDRREPGLVYAALGDPMHLAGQLARHAVPNTLLISEATAQRVRGDTVLGAGEAMSLAGAATPIRVYHVLGIQSRRAPTVRRGERVLSEFVGREQELAFLQRLLSQVERGRGQVVGIVGAPGMGKSRLLHEFRHSLRGKQVTYLTAHCRSYGGAIPSLPLLDLIRDYCGMTEADRPETIIEKVRQSLAEVEIDPAEGAPYLLHFLEVQADTAWLAGRSPEAARVRTFALLRQMLLKRSHQQPLILAVDDLHWIDRTSEEVYAALIESLASAPIFLLVTYRPGYRPAWITKSYVSQLTLPPLSPQESRTVIHARTSAAQLPQGVIEEILAKAEGNPFFLEELSRIVVAQSDAQAHMPIPATIEDVLLARMGHLPEAARRLLQTAAVVGRRGALRLLETVWEGPEALEPTLRELQQLEFLSVQPEAPEPAYIFTHTLTQEVAYASLAPARQQALHAAAGQALETLSAPHLEAVYDRLAYHYARAHDASKAVEYLTRCAAQATGRYAYPDAALALQQALEHAEHLPAAQRDRSCLEVGLHLAQAWSFLVRFAESLALLRQHHERLAPLQDPSLASAYYFRLGRIYSLLGDQAQAAQYTQRSLAAATQGGDSVAMGKAYYDLARECCLSGPCRPGLAYGQRALALLEHAAGEEWWLGLTYWIVGSLHGLLGDFAPALAATARAQALGAALDDRHVQSYAASATGWIEAMRGEWTAGIAACEQSLAWALDPVNVALATGTLGYAYLEQGEATQAIPLLEQVAQQWGIFGLQAMQGWMTSYLAEAYLATGHLAAAQDLARQGVAISSAVRCRFALGCAQRALGRIAQASDMLPDAANHLTEALHTFTALEARFEVGRTHLDLAAVAQAQGQQHITATHLTQAQTVFQTL